MATRLSVIATRTGDKGTTGLGDGTRVDKDAPRIAALGDVDELNSLIGLWRTEPLSDEVDALLGTIQHHLFDLGGELCIPGYTALKAEHVLTLEQALAKYNAELGKLEEFILPGGTRAAALAHMARTVVTLGRNEEVSEAVRQYLNRLSDLCFVLARSLNRAAGRTDVLWQR
jgi:cob(I)alamin adenosyltransferase